MEMILAAALATAFVIGLVRWRQAVVAVMVLAVVDGAVRKWVFPAEQQWVYLVKDVLLLGAYAGCFGQFVAERRAPSFRHPATIPLMALGFFALVQLANPKLPDFWLGIFGVRSYLIYVPLLFVVPQVFRDTKELRRFWLAYLTVALVPMILGYFQFEAPRTSAINRYAWDEHLVTNVAALPGGVHARITGTFSYVSGYTAYLVLIVLVALALVTFHQRGRLKFALLGLIGLALGNLFMTGSRAPFLVLAVAVATLAYLPFQLRTPGAMRGMVVLLVGVPLVGILAEGVFPEAYQEFADRVAGTTDLRSRLVGLVRNPLEAVEDGGVFGYGIGTTHQARTFFDPGDAYSAPPPAEGEGERERIILEMGVVGFGLVFVARFLVSYQLWVALRRTRMTELRPFLAAALLYTLGSLPSSLVFNHTAHLFYWFVAGMGLIGAEDGVGTWTSDELPL